MAEQVTRYSTLLEGVHIDTVLADSDSIEYRSWAGGMVYVPAGSSLTLLTWCTSTAEDGTFLPATDGAGNAITSTVAAGMACLIPAALFGALWIKATGNADGTISVSLKG